MQKRAVDLPRSMQQHRQAECWHGEGGTAVQQLVLTFPTLVGVAVITCEESFSIASFIFNEFRRVMPLCQWRGYAYGCLGAVYACVGVMQPK